MSVIVDGVTYDIPVVELRRKAQFLDKFAERTQDGELKRELIGIFFNYELQLGQTTNVSEYASFWKKITEVVEFHFITVPDEDGVNYSFQAYCSNISDTLKRIKNGQPYYKELTVNFIAKSPAT